MTVDRAAIVERVEAFDREHGESIVYEGWILFEDGASREINPLGALMPAPSDPVARARKILFFYRFKAQHLTQGFESRRRDLELMSKAALARGVAGTPLTPERLADLQKLHAAAKQAQEALKAKETELAPGAKSAGQQAHEARTAAARAENEKALKALQDLKL